MDLKKIKVVTILLLVFKISSVTSFSIVLDQAQDIEPLMWHIDGYVEYLEDGNALRGPINQYLPDNFQYSNVALSRGIWAIVPGKQCVDDNDATFASYGNWAKNEKSSEKDVISKGINFKNPFGCDRSAVGTFKFRLAAQLADSVKVKYCFGGRNSTIKISRDDGHVYLEVKSKKKILDNWIESTTQLDGTSMLIEASVGGEGDYILIDTITVNTMEVTTAHPTTPTKSPKTTTTSTEQPTSTTLSPTTSKSIVTTTEHPDPEPIIPTSGQQSVILSSSSSAKLFVSLVIVKIFHSLT